MMNTFQEKITIMKEYYRDIPYGSEMYIYGKLPFDRVSNAISIYAKNLDQDKIIGFCDTSKDRSGKTGCIFTEDKVFYQMIDEDPKILLYNTIKEIKLIDRDQDKDCLRGLEIKLNDGRIVRWFDCKMNKTPLYLFFNEMIRFDKTGKRYKTNNINYEQVFDSGSVAAGSAIGAYSTVNRVFDEEKFHSRQGHGFAAERANHMYDKITGHDAKIVGDNNTKNGADRIVDGINIQSKYCASGSRCVNECFSNNGKGDFRYYSSNGKPMQIEVPSDKYTSSIEAMEEKIRRGQVKGVSNPAEAKNIIRKGHFTYAQAKNIAKAGTVESLTYDSVHGIKAAKSAFGVSSLLSFAVSIWSGDSFDIALEKSAISGIKVGGTAFLTNVLVNQLSKAGLNSALVGSSEAIVSLMGPKASAIIVNAFRSGTNIYGAAAMKSAAKLLRGNVITAGVTVVLLSTVDVADIFRGRISGKQLFKNIAGTTSTIAGGSVGWIGGAAIGSAFFPGVGTVVGGLIGSLGLGAVTGQTTKAVLNEFMEDDADEMIRIIQKRFEKLAADYLLNQKEAERIVDNLKKKLDGNKLKEMYASSNRSQFAENILIPLIEKEVSNRQYIKLPTNKEMLKGIRTVLEKVADAS